ncbi:phospho-N-acetylmuramoyl-pentapeptide-transferase [Candidatus Saccharibacteria bacterium CPR2]|nr:phospho-N-acetylmuramoyl-pentapeptide-transferase [Candidatus Saccharibacteria bacterium CPR2]
MDIFNIKYFSNEAVNTIMLGTLAFSLSMLITPIYTTFAYRYKLWKKPRQSTLTGEAAKVFTKLHKAKHRRHIPTMAGLIFLLSIVIVTVFYNFNRQQTWLPLAATIGAGMIGFVDDIINLRGVGKGIAGLNSKIKFLSILIVAGIGGWYFYFKLGYDTFNIPFAGEVNIGWLLIPLFMLVVVSTANAVNITDGLDGLAGGLLTSAFLVYALIAFLQGNYGIAGFCVTIVGALLSYVWFNIYPARFFMGDIGSFALGTALGVVAMLTDTLVLLPVIGIVFVIEAGSSLIQVLSKKILGRKIFQSAPIHHHFEAIGWPETKVTMRFWLIGQMAGVLGLIIALIGGLV